MSGSSADVKLCGSCHESCLTCKGLLDSDCLICDKSFNRIVMGSHSLCIREPQKTKAIPSEVTSELHWYSQPKKFVLFILVALLVAIYFGVSSCKKKKILRVHDREENNSGKYVYIPIRNENEDILLPKKNIQNEKSYVDESDESEN
jgi:hypothetical protein